MFKTILTPKFNGSLNHTDHEMDGAFPRSVTTQNLICRSYATRDELNCNGVYDIGFTLRWKTGKYYAVISGNPRYVTLIYNELKKHITTTYYTNGSILFSFPDTEKSESIINFIKDRYYVNLGETLSELYRNSPNCNSEIPSNDEDIERLIEIKKRWLY